MSKKKDDPKPHPEQRNQFLPIARRDLIRGVGLGSAFFLFPWSRSKMKNTIHGLSEFICAQDQQFFDPCPPFNQYSDGDDCGTHDCNNDFKCTGGVLDDFECTVNFTCGTPDHQNQFRCENSFDDEDCEGGFTCNWFNCADGGYTPPVV